MAHIAKYKATSVGHMLAHYRRDESSLGRDNIDPKRVKNDMVVAHYTNKDGKLVVGRVVPREGEPNWGTVERRIERVNEAQKAAGKRATRKDAVVMADVVVTLPDNVRKGDEDRFFRLTYWYLSNKFGIDNMMGGYVHKDEETPHAHFGFVPLRDGKLSWKGFFPDKAALGAMQDRFYGRVGALYGLSRGEKRLEGQPARRHKSVAEYKAESRREPDLQGRSRCGACLRERARRQEGGEGAR